MSADILELPPPKAEFARGDAYTMTTGTKARTTAVSMTA
jgi:hypothetical protein